MSNIGKLLKDEIARIARREARGLIRPLHRESSRMRKTLAACRRQVRAMERDVAWAVRQAKKQVESPAIPTGASAKRWISSKGIKALRRKFGISRADFGKLIGAATPTIAQWESKPGKIEFRKKDTMARIETVRTLGARDVRRLLVEEPEVNLKKYRRRGTKKMQ